MVGSRVCCGVAVVLFASLAAAAPVAIYHMDDVSGPISDSAGIHDGAFNGAATDYGHAGPFGGALRFRGGQTVNAGNILDLNDRSFTIEGWVKADAARATTASTIMQSVPQGRCGPWASSEPMGMTATARRAWRRRSIQVAFRASKVVLPAAAPALAAARRKTR